MQLRSLEKAHVPLVAGWLAQEENHKWLDFGRGRQQLTEATLAIMIQQSFHRLFTFAADGDEDGSPIGVVGLTDISDRFRSATLWYVLGDKSYARQGYTSRAVRAALQVAFGEMNLHSVEAWALEENHGSIVVLERNKFKQQGRRRECHELDGKLRDRLHFDILEYEFAGDD